MSTPSGRVVWVGRGISLVVALAFVASAAVKFLGTAQETEALAHLGIPETLVMPLGILELACAAIYLVPRTAVLGAILLTGYLGGAILTHLRVGDPYFVQIGLGILLWLGLYLRDPRLKAFLPLMTP